MHYAEPLTSKSYKKLGHYASLKYLPFCSFANGWMYHLFMMYHLHFSSSPGIFTNHLVICALKFWSKLTSAIIIFLNLHISYYFCPNFVLKSSFVIYRFFTETKKLKPEEAIVAALSSLPRDLIYMVGVVYLPCNDPRIDKRRKIAALKLQEKVIKVSLFSFCFSF